MFSITEFIMKTLKGMIGKYPDFQIREYALNWYSKGKLTEEDLAEIETLIEAQYIVPTPPVEEIEDELIGDISTEESTEIENETILDGEEETQTEVEESQTETEIIEDSTNEESTEQTEEVVEESATEPTE